MKPILPLRRAAALIAVLVVVVTMAAEPVDAYREEVRTPHWEWVDRHAGGTIDVLFIASFLGGREPGELAQRFDMTTDVVPVAANPSGIPTEYDEAYLMEALATQPDVIVVPYRGAWGRLSAEAQQALVDAVASGTPLIALSAGNAPDALYAEPLPDVEEEAQAAAERNLPVRRLHFPWGRDNGRIGVKISRHGAGHYLNVGMGHGAGGGFNAFIPSANQQPPSSPAAYEIAYATFGRLIRWAAGMTATGPIGSVAWDRAPPLGAALPVTVALAEPAPDELTVEWELHSPVGDSLGKGSQAIPAGANEAEIAPTLTQAGELTLRYRLRSDGKVTDYGAVAVPVATPIASLELRVPERVAPGQPVTVSWSLEGALDAVGGFLLQVYDPRGRLVAWSRAEASAREGRLDGWQPLDIRHQLRLLVLDAGGNILHESREPLHVQVDRSEDLSQFHVMAWATEKGDPQEQWRYHRLRQLGINAFSPIGKGMAVTEMAADAGLRLAPVNISVPPGRFKKEFDTAKEREELVAYSKAMAPLSPLGYSLADAPAGVDLAGFRNWAAEIIHQHDPGVPVGYCGTHMKVGMDLPGILSACDFMIHYTPHYLYTSDLWRGIERDLHRAFTPAGAFNTAYTHYVPWADHEPYSRTSPWLLLFEGAQGISYFASAGGNFSILSSDLRTTHETRWWSEEIRELQRGIARQLIAMERQPGGIAVLFPTHLPDALSGAASRATTLWAEALRELNLPYTFVAPDELATLDPTATPLLICPPVPVLASEALAAVTRYVEEGGTLVATAPFALVEPQPVETTETPFWERQPEPPNERQVPTPGEGAPEPTEDAITDLLEGEPVAEEEPAPPPPPAATLLDIEPLFGIQRQPAGTQTREALFDAIATRARIPTEVTWADGQPLALAGSTAGQAALAATDAEILASFPDVDADAPDFAKEALSSPAVFRVRRGQGSAYYFNVVPEPASAQQLLQRLQGETRAAPAPARVTVDEEPAPAVYLYPLEGGGVRTLGIIQDYERVKPVFQNDDKQTAIYYHHGPLRWAEEEATLELDAPVHLYDMRRRQYLGETATAGFALLPGRPELFALLPYRVDGLEVAVADSVSAGGSLNAELRLVTDSGTAGDHTVHLRLVRKDHPEEAAFATSVMLTCGRGSVIVPTAFNDPAGAWVLQVSDVLTGTQAEAEVQVEASDVVGPLLPRRDVEVTSVALDWPRGEWQPYQAPDSDARTDVDVHVGGIQRRRINYGPFDGMWCLTSKNMVRLTNSHTTFRFSYLACNDWQKKGWEDKRRVQGHSLSGLGMNQPAGHLWYANGYIDIYFDDVRVTGYRIADAQAVDAGSDGRVDITWESPSGTAVLSFGLTLEGETLLQQLRVRPSVAVETVRVEFRSYIGGFGHSSTRYVRTAAGKNAKVSAPSEAPWAFYADDVNDQAYGKGMGAGGILIRPGQWDRVRYGLSGALEKRVDLQAGESAAFEWALWVYPKLTNAEAFEAFTETRPVVNEQLQTFFKQNKR